MDEFRKLINYIKENQLILATAESCTAGEIMSTIANEGDCGHCLFIGYVVYSETAKKKELGIKASTINKYTLTSEEVAQEMARGVFKHTEINVAIATTGITGDKPMNGIPPGTVCIAWAFKRENNITIFSETQLFKERSKKLSIKAAHYALLKLEHYHKLFLVNNS